MDARRQIAAGCDGEAQSGAPPPDSPTPIGPHIQESLGGGRGVVTHEDLLQSPHDEDLFEFYATSQLALVDSVSGQISPVGKPALLESARISPDGNDFIVTTIHRPFSYSYQARQFPTEIEAWDRTGTVLHKLASLPLGFGGGRRGGGGGATPAGPLANGGRSPGDNSRKRPLKMVQRTATWLPSEPATLMWVEGTGGDGRGGGRGGHAMAPSRRECRRHCRNTPGGLGRMPRRQSLRSTRR